MIFQEMQHSFICRELYIPTLVQDLTFEEYVSLFFPSGNKDGRICRPFYSCSGCNGKYAQMWSSQTLKKKPENKCWKVIWDLLKILSLLLFFWYIRFYGRHVSRRQANTKTCCKWFSATGVTSSCGWVIQQFSCLNTEWKGKMWLAKKAMLCIPRQLVCSRTLAWNQVWTVGDLRLPLMLVGIWK